MGLKVCKFGGSSLADAKAMKQVAEIIRSDSARKYVVVSAPGKRFADDIKITDSLYACARAVAEKGTCAKEFEKIADRYIGIVNELALDLDIESLLKETRESIDASGGDADFSASRGEFLNAIIVSKLLGYDFIDAEELIKFDDDGKFNAEYTNDVTSARLKKHQCAVIPGFYGSRPGDVIKTFSRGGSDITGAIVARAVNADVYENWTDVDGFCAADPRIVKNPAKIDVISYKELRELSYMGASVLHAEAIFPVSIAGIPINIRNTFAPEGSGTLIVPNSDHTKNGKLITGIAGRKGYVVITVEKSMMNEELGFTRRVLSVLERYGVSFEHVPTGIDTLSLVISASELSGRLEKIIQRIREAVDPDSITIDGELALVATVGHGMSFKKGTAGRLFNALSKADINIRMIDQGSSEMNIIVGVIPEDYEKTILAIYDEFIGNQNA